MKKQLPFLSLLALIGAFVFSLEGCGDDPKPDPCAKEKPVTADFLIYESFGLALDGWKNYDTDTVATFGATFLALEKNATYEWRLGSETITTRSFYRSNYPRGKTIDISLKVTKSPNTKCFPSDDGIDFKERTFYTTPDFGCSSLVTGTFRGSDEDDPKNLRDISFEVCAPNPNPNKEPGLSVNNLVPGCNYFGFAFVETGYQQVGFAGAHGNICKGFGGAAKLDSLNNNRMVITYSVEESSTSVNRINKKFIGTRIK